MQTVSLVTVCMKCQTMFSEKKKNKKTNKKKTNKTKQQQNNNNKKQTNKKSTTTKNITLLSLEFALSVVRLNFKSFLDLILVWSKGYTNPLMPITAEAS